MKHSKVIASAYWSVIVKLRYFFALLLSTFFALLLSIISVQPVFAGNTAENGTTESAAADLIGADLVVSYLTVNPGTLLQGGTTTVQFTVRNAGVLNAGAFTLRFYLSTNTNITTSDTYLNSEQFFSGLNAGTTSQVYTTTVQIPTSVSTGTEYFGAIVDYSHSVSEVDEGNNTRYVTTTVQAAPDLRVSLLSINPSLVAQGRSTIISYRVYNAGTSLASNFSIRFYFSSNDTITTADTYLNYQRTFSALNPGSSSATYTATVGIPITALTGAHYIGAIVDYNNSVAESVETNNTRSVPITILGIPDIEVSYLSINPTSALQGSAVSITYRVINTGSAASGSFVLRLYLSTNDTISTSDAYLNYETVVSSIDPGASVTYATTISIPPNSQTGARYIGAIADYNQMVTEQNEANNTRATAITIEAAPDLQVFSISVNPASMHPGEATTVRYQVHNAGLATASNFTVRLYFSVDNILTTTDTYLNYQRTFSRLYAGTTSSQYEAIVNIPVSALVGTRFIGAIVDYNNAVTESIETNNTRSVPITVQGQPDLQVSILSASPDSLLQGGATTITYQVFNAGTASASNFMLKLYFSADNMISATDTYLNTYKYFSTLEAGAYSGTYNRDVNIPTFAQAGTRYIGAIVDDDHTVVENNETNNTRYDAITVQDAPDMQVTFLSATPGSIPQGNQTTIQYTIRNTGAADAGDSTLRFYYSDDTSITGNDTLIGELEITSLISGTLQSGDLAVWLPASAAPGSSYIGAIADAAQQIPESNEDNNTRAHGVLITATPDLQLSDLSVNPGKQSPGGQVELSYQVHNGGSATTNSSIPIAVYMSDFPDLTVADTLLGSDTIPEIAAGNNYDGIITVTLPSSSLDCAGYIGVIADNTNDIVESIENNNARSVTFRCDNDSILDLMLPALLSIKRIRQQ